MTAKSAPQLTAPPSTRASLHPRTLLLLVLAIVMASTAWLLDQQGTQAAAAAGPAAPAEPEAAADSVSVAQAPAEAAKPVENSRFRALSEFLAKRYKVSQAVTFDLVSMAHAAGQQMGLDPLLIIAVMAVESRFNPIAESVAGAKGLMQVIPKYHLEKFREYGGEKYAVFDPETNILVGSQILKDYLARTGSLNSALQLYVGASDEEDVPYIDKVMTEKQRLQQVLRNKPAKRPDVEASMAGERFASAY
ncbi:MAG: transglycosylase domain protein [Betaproteobacteria bacterium]|nr:transglycosylase domain protein [Betaproteobacteria bacterium]